MPSNWFPHDSSAGMDQHVLLLRGELGNSGYGMFWLALEAMYETADGKLDATALPALCIRMNESKEVVSSFFDTCKRIGLFIEKDGKIFSERLVSEKQLHIAKSEAQRQRAANRWEKEKARLSNATALPTQSHGNAPTHPPTLPTHSESDHEVCDHLRKRCGIKKPDAWLSKLRTEGATDKAIRRAWEEWKRGCVESAADFWSRSLAYSKQ